MLLAHGCASEEAEPTVLCGGGPLPCVDVRFVAHEDDDLLFMNPDIAASLASGNRVVTVFVTAGTSTDPARMSQRERGMLNAYAFMVAPEYAVTTSDAQAEMLARWKLAGDQPVSLDIAGGTRQAIQYDFVPGLPSGGLLSLVFLRLVEENGVDLRALLAGEVDEISTVPCASECVHDSVLPAQPYRTEQLLDVLEAVMQRFEDPASRLSVSTLDATRLYHREVSYGLGWVDHADHLATAEFVVGAYVRHHRRPGNGRTLHQYRAYNTGREHANVGSDIRDKRRAFYRYVVLGEGLDGLDQNGKLVEYTNRKPDDPHFTNTAYESWTERRYVLSSVPPASGRLAVGSRCLQADPALSLGPCAGAPDWELASDDQLHPVSDPVSCVVLDDLGTAGVARCPPGADAERQTFVLTSTGQLRTRRAACVEADSDGVRAAGCDKRVDGDGDPIGRPVDRQRWTWR